VRHKQELAIAHMQAEAWAESAFSGAGATPDAAPDATPDATPHATPHAIQLYAPETVQSLHHALFQAHMPSAWRDRNVQVGRHVAPDHAAVPQFLARWQEVYGSVRPGEAALVAAAASHHRLAWIHPFEDGNGRVARLHTHLLLHAMGLTKGLWSPLRGMARNQARYYALLDGADAPRAGDLDGRGNLSEAGLIAFIGWFLEICIDQARFMAKLLDVSDIKSRMAAALHFWQAQGTGVRIEALHALHYVFLAGPVERGEFRAMMGLSDRAASTVLAAMLKLDLLRSDTAKGKVGFAVPLHALRFYFPALWPEAEAGA
jgi:Fic family protein